jgi:hypothetical protein
MLSVFIAKAVEEIYKNLPRHVMEFLKSIDKDCGKRIGCEMW